MANPNRHDLIFDVDLRMKDAGLVAASAAAQVGGSNKVLDLGASYVEGALVVDTTTVEVASGDEKYEIEWQLSNVADFSSAVFVAAAIKLGDSSVTGSSADSPAAGRYVQPVTNEFNGTVYRYARLFTRIAGTIATGINYAAHLTRQ